MVSFIPSLVQILSLTINEYPNHEYLILVTFSSHPLLHFSPVIPLYLPVGVFGLESMSLDDVDSDQALLDAVGRQLSELPWGNRGTGVIRQWVDLKHALVHKGEGWGIVS